MSTIKPLHIIKPSAHPMTTFMTEEFIKGADTEKKCHSTCSMVCSRKWSEHNNDHKNASIKSSCSWLSSYTDGGIAA
jgi:hypothetical protein